jgi:hypothetical protein
VWRLGANLSLSQKAAKGGWPCSLSPSFPAKKRAGSPARGAVRWARGRRGTCCDARGVLRGEATAACGKRDLLLSPLSSSSSSSAAAAKGVGRDGARSPLHTHERARAFSTPPARPTHDAHDPLLLPSPPTPLERQRRRSRRHRHLEKKNQRTCSRSFTLHRHHQSASHSALLSSREDEPNLRLRGGLLYFFPNCCCFFARERRRRPTPGDAPRARAFFFFAPITTAATTTTTVQPQRCVKRRCESTGKERQWQKKKRG